MAYGFKQSKADPCMFINENSKKATHFILHVGDILITSVGENEIEGVINYLKDYIP